MLPAPVVSKMRTKTALFHLDAVPKCSGANINTADHARDGDAMRDGNF
jgi:hypothetical protein